MQSTNDSNMQILSSEESNCQILFTEDNNIHSLCKAPNRVQHWIHLAYLHIFADLHSHHSKDRTTIFFLFLFFFCFNRFSQLLSLALLKPQASDNYTGLHNPINPLLDMFNFNILHLSPDLKMVKSVLLKCHFDRK